MPKQCPECSTVTTDEIGYCPACAHQLNAASEDWTQSPRLWQYAAAAAAVGTLAASLLHFWPSGH